MLSPRVPELSALQMLSSISRLGSFSATGKELGLSQQAVSSRMRALERQVGSTLFVRTPRGSALSPTGLLVANWADDVLAAAARLDAGIAAIRTDVASRLPVVASQTVAQHLLPQWLVTLRQQEAAQNRTPSVIELSVTNSATAIDMVMTGGAVVGFIETSVLPRGLAHTVVDWDTLVVVVAPDDPWAHRSSALTLAELAATPLVTREIGSGTRGSLEQLLTEQVPHIPLAAPVVELSTAASVRSAIAAGIAPGVLSASAVHDDVLLGRLVIVPTPGTVLSRPLSAIWRSGVNPPRGPARDLVDIAAR